MMIYLYSIILLFAKRAELLAGGSLCEQIENSLESSGSHDNLSEPIDEPLGNNYTESTLLNNLLDVASPGNDSVTNDTTISNATLIKKFTCLLDEAQQENPTFQVCHFQSIIN